MSWRASTFVQTRRRLLYVVFRHRLAAILITITHPDTASRPTPPQVALRRSIEVGAKNELLREHFRCFFTDAADDIFDGVAAEEKGKR
jgi:hypothetical protein